MSVPAEANQFSFQWDRLSRPQSALLGTQLRATTMLALSSASLEASMHAEDAQANVIELPSGDNRIVNWRNPHRIGSFCTFISQFAHDQPSYGSTYFFTSTPQPKGYDIEGVALNSATSAGESLYTNTPVEMDMDMVRSFPLGDIAFSFVQSAIAKYRTEQSEKLNTGLQPPVKPKIIGISREQLISVTTGITSYAAGVTNSAVEVPSMRVLPAYRLASAMLTIAIERATAEQDDQGRLVSPIIAEGNYCSGALFEDAELGIVAIHQPQAEAARIAVSILARPSPGEPLMLTQHRIGPRDATTDVLPFSQAEYYSPTAMVLGLQSMEALHNDKKLSRCPAIPEQVRFMQETISRLLKHSVLL